MNLYIAEHGNEEKKVLSQLNQECGKEEIYEVEEFEVENLVENWVSPMKVKMIARKFAMWNLTSQHFITIYHTTKYTIFISLMLIWKSS